MDLQPPPEKKVNLGARGSDNSRFPLIGFVAHNNKNILAAAQSGAAGTL
jgi:hypothetical protein